MGILRYGGRFFLAAILPIDRGSYDRISKNSKYAQNIENSGAISETGWDRLKQMFQFDEIGGISSELNSIYQAGFLGTFTGALYGGIIYSRKGYIDFMENNEATTFKSHLDAKRKLQDQFTVNFAKGAFRWGWRIGLFTTTYVAIITCISVYREKSSIYEYLAAGGITGSLYKINLGLRGMIAGGIVGGVLGGVAGGISLLIINASGTSISEVRYWQYKWKLDRDAQIIKAIKADMGSEDELLKLHDQQVSSEVSLDEIK